jgi:hypothetical protein
MKWFAHGQPVAVGGDVVGDRVQQVRLAEPGRAADEERVVGERRHLGNGQRGAVGEAIGVADDELVEREAGVEGDVGGRPQRARGRLLRPARGGGVLRADELDRDVLAEHPLRAGLEHAAEALAHPRAARVRRADDERRAVEPARVERREIVLPGVVRDRGPELRPDALPGMRKFVGHDGRGGFSSPGEVVWIGRAEGP